MENCLFCKIIKNEIPSTKIYEDEHSFAFLDVNPVNKGHTLLVPKKHSRNIFDTEDITLEQLAPTIKKLSNAVRAGTEADGINIGINNEPSAGQVIFHLHIHIIPRYTDDGLISWSGKDAKDLDKTAEKIKSHM